MKYALLPLVALSMITACRDNPEPPLSDNFTGIDGNTVSAENLIIESNQASAADNETANATTELPDIPGDTVYNCTPEMTVSTRFAAQQVSSEESAGGDDLIVMVNGKAHLMEQVPSGSGAKYRASNGLIWWNKGKEATLFETKGGNEAILTTCTEKG